MVSTSDDPHEVRSLLGLGPAATSAGIPAVVGAGMAPGLHACWRRGRRRCWTRSGSTWRAWGPGGRRAPRRHHAALREGVDEWRDGAHRVGGSGRELRLVPGQCRRRLLPGEPSRPSAAYQGLPRAQVRHDESGGLAS